MPTVGTIWIRKDHMEVGFSSGNNARDTTKFYWRIFPFGENLYSGIASSGDPVNNSIAERTNTRDNDTI